MGNPNYIYKEKLSYIYNTSIRKYNKVYASLLFLVWPFGLFLLASKNFTNKGLRKYILFFIIIFGASLIVDEQTSHDAYAHAQKLKSIASLTIDDLFNVIKVLLSGKSEDITDIYVTIINFVVSRLTTSHHFLFAFHAFVFGYFYLKSITLVYDEFGKINNINALLFFTLFISIISIEKIQYVRFWTASWIYIYAVLQLLKNKKPKYFIILLSSVLIHASFLLPIIVFLMYLVGGNRINLYLGILLISIVIPNFFTSYLSKINSIGFGDIFDQQIAAYTQNEEYILQRASRFDTRSWYVRLQVPLLHYSLLPIISYIFIKRKKVIFDKLQISLLSFIILFLSLVNFSVIIASLGERLIFIYFVLIAVFLFRFFSLNKYKSLTVLTFIILPAYCLWIIMQLRFISEVMNVYMIFGNPFLLLIDSLEISLYDFIQYFTS